MGTMFEILIQNEDARYARQAAYAAFDEIDRIESQISRYLSNSDVNRINTLSPGQTLRLGIDAFDCLVACQQLYTDTQGAFDVTIGQLIDAYKQSAEPPAPGSLESARAQSGFDTITLDPKTLSITLSARITLDFGGFGKGYAIDRVVALFDEWDIDTALIHGGGSSVYALGDPSGQGWPLAISDPAPPHALIQKYHAVNQAISSSGIRKGAHIIDPRTALPVAHRQAVWIVCDSAATADGLSTALMVMTMEEVNAFQRTHDFEMILR
jgi:thiamine biosynthesis lipoprotein